MEDLVNILLTDVVVPALGLLAVWAIGEATRYLRSKTKNENTTNALERLSHTATSAVAELEQVVVPAMRERSADGHLSSEDRLYLKRLAIQRVKERVAPELQAIAQKAVANIDIWLSSKVEQAKLDLKRGEFVTLEAIGGEVVEAPKSGTVA